MSMEIDIICPNFDKMLMRRVLGRLSFHFCLGQLWALNGPVSPTTQSASAGRRDGGSAGQSRSDQTGGAEAEMLE
jgi:hypothetical protein